MDLDGIGSLCSVPSGVAGLIPAVITLPEKAAGIVVFVDGLCRPQESAEVTLLQRHFYGSGIGTLVLHPDSPLLGFDPDRASTTRRTSVIDSGVSCLGDVIAWLTSEARTEGLGVGFYATDGGTAVALITAADIAGAVQAVVSVGGRPDLAGNALEWVVAPTLLVAAEEDPEVLAFNEMAFDLMEGENELEILLGVRHHTESREALGRVVVLAVDWFREHLQCPS